MIKDRLPCLNDKLKFESSTSRQLEYGPMFPNLGLESSGFCFDILHGKWRSSEEILFICKGK